MRNILFFLMFIAMSVILHAQAELGLHGNVTWIDATHIRVEYDWSDDSQLSDWNMTNGSTLVRSNGRVTITGGNAAVRAMVWKQEINCSKIIAKDAVSLSAEAQHLNIYTNLVSFSGQSYLPDPGLGAVVAGSKNFWVQDGAKGGNIGTLYITAGVPEDYEYTASSSGITFKSSADNVTYSLNTVCYLDTERKVALGGWGGNTGWGTVIIEGEIRRPWQDNPVPSDVINIETAGAVFAPVIEVVGNPVIQWIFDDSTTSSSAKPHKDYGSKGNRRNYLKVTPWSALVGINVGYDASDGGYGKFDRIDRQNVIGFQNLGLAKNSLRYICANYNLITELDLRGISKIEFVELYRCEHLSKIRLDSHPVLERLCVERCRLDSLDISGCTGLKDFRGAKNNYTFINWGSVGHKLWHICVRDNPQFVTNLPPLTQFPVLKELFTWNTSQTGAFVCHSSYMEDIDSWGNSYTSADVSGCTNLRRLSLSGSPLTSINLDGAKKLTYVRLKNCSMTNSQVDYVLEFLDEADRKDGYLEIDQNNAPPTVKGYLHYKNLINKGWTIQINIDEPEFPQLSVTQDEIKAWLDEDFISWKADLFSLSGEMVMNKYIDSDILCFEVSALPAGVYILNLSNDKNFKSMKLFKPGVLK